MCHAILKVRYRGSDAAFIEVESADQLDAKLDDVKNRPEVQSVSIYGLKSTHKLIAAWKVDSHE